MANFRHLLIALATSGCVGSLVEPPAGDGPNGPASGGNGGFGANGGNGANGANGGNGGNGANSGSGGSAGSNPTDPRLEARLWRLTPAQFNGEVQRMFPGAPAVDLPVGGSEYGLTNISSAARIDTGNATQYSEAARAIGAWVAAQGAGAARCTTFGNTACVDSFLNWFPEAAYRRPPTPEEKTELRGVYDELVGPYGAEWAFAAVVRTVLLSPHFVYRSEIGPAGTGVIKMTDHEIASLISFSLTDKGPDAALLADAKAGKLQDAAAREQHARRLMPQTTAIWQRFFWEWLKMSTLESQGNETGLDPALVAALEEEYRAFVENIVINNRGTLDDLLTSNATWGTAAVATYYGASHPGGGVAQIQLNPNQRGGLLNLGAWLVAHGKKGRDNVVRRGMGVYRDAMCQNIKPLDIDLEAAVRDLVGANATIKQIADARSADATCGACHRTSDPIGLAFESFAGDGRWQTTYPDGKPVEASVVLNGMPYDNPAQISAAIAKDERFQHCLVRRFGHFVLGAECGAPVEVRASADAYKAFKDSGGSLEELLVAVVKDVSFIERRK